MKVCVVTIYDEMNYGAYLQAYALGEIIKEYGNDVIYYKEKNKRLIDSIHSLHIRELRNLPFNVKLLNKYKSAWDEISDTREIQEDVDLAIIGSDELWNVRNCNFEHKIYYIGEGIKSQKCITYAVSCNNCTDDEFLRVYPNPSFRNLEAISVRDKRTFELVSTLSSRIPEEVLDPTFLVNFVVGTRIYKKKYILVYGYYFTENEIHKIQRLLNNIDDCELISVGFVHDWCDKNIPCGPLEFLNYIKNAEMVITSTFHGTALSIVFRKWFVTFARDNLKIQDLLEKFDLVKQNISLNENDFGKDEGQIYSTKTEKKIEYWKEKSLKFLGRYLEEM